MSLSAKSLSLLKRDAILFVTNLITGIVIARTLGPTALGLWVILQMILGYAESFGRLKFDIASIYVLGKKTHGIGDVVFTLNALAIVSSLLIVAVVVWRFEWFYQLLFAKSDVDVRTLMYVILLQVPLQFLSMNYSYLNIYREDIRSLNGMVVVKAVSSSVVAIVLLAVFKLGLIAVVASSLLSVLAGLIYGAFRFGRTAKASRYVNGPLIKDLASYGFILYTTGIIAQFNTFVTRLIVVFYLAPAQVAYFSMAQNQGQLLNMVPNSLNVLLYPRISKTASDDDSAGLAARAFRIVLILSLAAAAVAFAIIEPVVRLLYGQAFVAMVLPFRIILPGLVLSGAATVLDQYFAGIGRADISAKIAVAPLAIQVAAGLLLIPAYGLVGAALAFLFALLSLAFTHFAVFLHMSGRTFKADLVPRTSDVRVVTAFAKSELKKVVGRSSSAGTSPGHADGVNP